MRPTSLLLLFPTVLIVDASTCTEWAREVSASEYTECPSRPLAPYVDAVCQHIGTAKYMGSIESKKLLKEFIVVFMFSSARIHEEPTSWCEELFDETRERVIEVSKTENSNVAILSTNTRIRMYLKLATLGIDLEGAFELFKYSDRGKIAPEHVGWIRLVRHLARLVDLLRGPMTRDAVLTGVKNGSVNDRLTQADVNNLVNAFFSLVNVDPVRQLVCRAIHGLRFAHRAWVEAVKVEKGYLEPPVFTPAGLMYEFVRASARNNLVKELRTRNSVKESALYESMVYLGSLEKHPRAWCYESRAKDHDMCIPVRIPLHQLSCWSSVSPNLVTGIQQVCSHFPAGSTKSTTAVTKVVQDIALLFVKAQASFAHRTPDCLSWMQEVPSQLVGVVDRSKKMRIGWNPTVDDLHATYLRLAIYSSIVAPGIHFSEFKGVELSKKEMQLVHAASALGLIRAYTLDHKLDHLTQPLGELVDKFTSLSKEIGMDTFAQTISRVGEILSAWTTEPGKSVFAPAIVVDRLFSPTTKSKEAKAFVKYLENVGINTVSGWCELESLCEVTSHISLKPQDEGERRATTAATDLYLRAVLGNINGRELKQAMASIHNNKGIIKTDSDYETASDSSSSAGSGISSHQDLDDDESTMTSGTDQSADTHKGRSWTCLFTSCFRSGKKDTTGHYGKV